MATYNWSYRPGIVNKYGIVINPSDEDVKPDNATYVALWGNDIAGNGSRLKPFRTIAVAKQFTAYAFLIMGAGVYRENIVDMNGQGIYIIGDGEVKFDLSYFITDYFIASGSLNLYNLTFLGSGLHMRNNGQETSYSAFDCIFDNIYPSGTNGETLGRMENCIFKNFSGQIVIGYLNGQTTNLNCTYHKCSNVGLWTLGGETTNVIFNNCNITFLREQLGRDRYCIFYHCNYRNLEGGNHFQYPNGLLYPLISDDFTYIDNIEDLRVFINDFYPLSVATLYNCKVDDPKFNNFEIGDFSLQFDSPAKNSSYFGTYIGAQSIGYSIKVKSIESDGDFDFSTNINLNISDNSITFIDDSILASIETKIKPNLIGRELGRAPIYGFNADRNGQYIDSIADLSLITVIASELLDQNTPYIVENASIIYNSVVIQAGERFTTNNIQTFTTDGSGVCREIIEAPQRHTVMARFSNGGVTKIVGDALTVNYWYYVTGTIVYNGDTYTDQIFKAIDTSSFTGSGVVMEAMTNQVYQHYEPGIKFTSNNVGDVRTGEIIRGNGDPDYERGTDKEFPISARFIQIKYIIQPNNLRP